MKLSGIEKLATGIPGFDLISSGGLPKNRMTLVAGTSGSAKTVLPRSSWRRGFSGSAKAASSSHSRIRRTTSAAT
jgi:hypothetical protein